MKAENNCLWLKLDDDDDDWVNLMIMVTLTMMILMSRTRFISRGSLAVPQLAALCILPPALPIVAYRCLSWQLQLFVKSKCWSRSCLSWQHFVESRCWQILFPKKFKPLLPIEAPAPFSELDTTQPKLTFPHRQNTNVEYVQKNFNEPHEQLIEIQSIQLINGKSLHISYASPCPLRIGWNSTELTFTYSSFFVTPQIYIDLNLLW